MKKSVKNSRDNNFLKAIESFNSSAIRDKSPFEITHEGLKVFETIPELIWASLFILDTNDFDFYYKTSTSWKDENKIKNEYIQLCDEGIIAQALSELIISERTVKLNDGNVDYNLVIPLISKKGVIGLIILSFNSLLDDKDYVLILSSVHANSFALLLSNLDLLSENENLKVISEQQITNRTKDIVQSTRELKKILDSVHTSIIISDSDTEVIADANLMAVEMLGITKEKLIGTKKNEYFFNLDKKKQKDKSKTHKDGLLRKTNGNLIPIIQTLSKVKLGENEFTIDSFIDITERIKMEETLEKAHFELEQRVEERTIELSNTNRELKKEVLERKKAEADNLKLYRAIQQSPVAIIISDTDGRIEYSNPHLSQMTGYTFEEIIGKNLRQIKSEDISDEYCNTIFSTVLTGGEWKGEIRQRNKNGELFWLSSSISPMRNIDGDITNFLLVQENITEKKHAFESLVLAKELSEESNKLKSALLANMNHEFRTPLISILGFAQFLMSERLDEELHLMIEDIYSAGTRLRNTLDGVLKLSELEALKISLNITSADLTKIVNDSFEKFIPDAKGKGLEFSLQMKNDNYPVMVDVDQFKESIDYLIDNAIKYTTTGSVQIISDIKEKDENRWVTISVIDTGIGIEPENHKMVFEAFRQASEGFSRNYQGCGLGLTISQMKIKLINGHITLESESGKGSNFTIWIPYAELN
jgi:PAS domain S-box-containing protein